MIDPKWLSGLMERSDLCGEGAHKFGMILQCRDVFTLGSSCGVKSFQMVELIVMQIFTSQANVVSKDPEIVD